MSPAPLLELTNVTVLRGERPALQGVSLRIQSGEHVCVFGPNGCGKSTLIKTITRECYPLVTDDSSMTILGRERWDVAELRSHMGIVSPDLITPRTGDATGRQVVMSGFFASARPFRHHRISPELVARADEALARLDVSYLADRPLCEMSSGEAKRTLIARALVHRPATLLLDEPTSALDLAAQIHLKTTLRRLAREGLAIVLVTHQVSEILPEIERVVLLRRGRVMADGPKDRVLTEDNLEALFGVRVALARRDGFFHVEPAGPAITPAGRAR